ncbi:MAG: hypothetical protein EZS28_024008 [Streblomastix strix]|uniref:Uncharacterized protein n=1 Tax=Streblomastix strix TaxID=222440 RepID=A0A5J4VDB6_9EUKA|nr:MAG: hypothetical protein EZS28_024008 [Streblomastix strix]
METKTGSRMMNATDKQRNRNKSNLIENYRPRTNNNPNHNNPKCKQTQKQMKTKYRGVLIQRVPIHSYNLIQTLRQTKTQTIITYVHINTSYMSISQCLQPHSPILEYSEAILRTISSGDLRGHKEGESERKQTKFQQNAGLVEVFEKFHEIVKLVIQEEWKKPNFMQLGKTRDYPNKVKLHFFFSPKNYRPTLISRCKDINISEEQRNQFFEDVREDVVLFCL